MPKIKLADEPKIYKIFWGNVEKLRLIQDVSIQELALAAHVSQDTIYKRRKKPEKTTLKEMWLISKKLKSSVLDLLSE